MGDPGGIGPELVIKALAEVMDKPRVSFVVVGNLEVMSEAAKRFGTTRMKRLWDRCPRIDSREEAKRLAGRPLVFLSSGNLLFRDLEPGRPGAREGEAAWRSLEEALALVSQGICHALVTAPVSKAALKAAGFPSPGHTDWLALRTKSRAVMMLAVGRFRVVPVTVHVPLSDVTSDLSADKVLETITTVDFELKDKFRISRPRIAVAGLNPHAGEGGMLGTEEQEVIAPAVEMARSRRILVTGPHPADIMFTSTARKGYDAAVCMYHDQAMIPVKTMGMDKAVNVTLGLPLVRTSPAHGIAPDIAWKGMARPQSMIAAVKLAIRLAKRQRCS